MAAEARLGLSEKSEYLQRLAVVYDVELRMKIVTELYMREMSPSQFQREFGGGSLSRITHNFERLVETDWLREVRKGERGGARRGGVETFYRATELAIFDHETWPRLPYSLRAAFSWTGLKQMGERWQEALEQKTFDSRPERRGSYVTLLVDQEGWDRIRAAVDELFVACIQEQEDCRLRRAHAEEAPMLAVVSLLAFESMDDSGGRAAPELARIKREPRLAFPRRVSKLIGDEVSLELVAAANLEPISGKSFQAAYGGDIGRIRRRLKVLDSIDWLKQVGEKSGGTRRGAVEKFYRATNPMFGAGDPWNVPRSVEETAGWKKFREISEVAAEAIRAGTFDARPDRHLSWSLLRLDRQGWQKLTAAMEALRVFVLQEQVLARSRMAESGEQAICMTIAEGAFEAPTRSAISA